MTSIAIIGAGGKMGQRLVALAREYDCDVVAGIERGAGDAALPRRPQVVIDFSSPEGTRHWLSICHRERIAMLIGTTGLQRSDHDAIDDAAREIPILQSPNMSLGVAVLSSLLREASKLLGQMSDVEIVEAHHRTKRDAPSGTALALASALQRADVPIHSLRIGDEVGRHSVYLALPGERLELTHVATNRDTFARGALRAAAWLAQQNPGRYTIADVLGPQTR
jgi:4-hydroxy-tetrahydrodipicolinate reductase